MRIEKIGDATLYLADCREVLPTLTRHRCRGDRSAVWDRHERGWTWRTRASSAAWFDLREIACGCENDGCVGTWKRRLIARAAFCWRSTQCPAIIVWAAITTTCRHRSLLVRYGTRRERELARSQRASLAWTNIAAPVVRYAMCNGLQGIAKRSEHPTQKPSSLMRGASVRNTSWHYVLDPFMGSGTTGVACARPAAAASSASRSSRNTSISPAAA